VKTHTTGRVLFSICVLFGTALFCSRSVRAQDLVVTVRYDTLNCKLGKLTGDYYPIKFIWDDGQVSGMIHKDTVLYHRKNIFRGLDDNRLRPWYPTVSLGVDAGAGRQFGPLRTGLTEDFKPEKGSSSDRNGFYAGVDLAVYLSARAGYGLRYHYRSLLGGDIRQNYAGPMTAFRFWDRKRKNHWFMYLSAGYGRMVHRNAMVKVGTREPEPVRLTAGTLAGDIAAGYDLKLSRKVSARFKLSLTMAYPGYVRIFDYAGINPGGAHPAPDISGYCHNMNSVNLSVGFGFH
jgi:hypothetical protein